MKSFFLFILAITAQAALAYKIETPAWQNPCFATPGDSAYDQTNYESLQCRESRAERADYDRRLWAPIEADLARKKNQAIRNMHRYFSQHKIDLSEITENQCGDGFRCIVYIADRNLYCEFSFDSTGRCYAGVR